MDTFGKRLKWYAKTRHGGVGRMAEALDVDASQFSAYTSDARMPDSKMLQRLRYGGVSVDWLFTGDGDPDADPIPADVDNGESRSGPDIGADVYLREIEGIIDRWRKKSG